MHREVDRDFFKTWTPDMAYILGYLAADGTLSTSTGGAKYISLEIVDRDILVAYRRALRSNHKIARIKNYGSAQDTFRVQIGSKVMYNDLQKLGFTEKKTHRLTMPNVPDDVFGDFVRGYFDGDGHVWVGKIHKKRKTQSIAIESVFTSGTKAFLVCLGKRLSERGIHGAIHCQNGYYRLSFSIISSIKLYELMYGEMASPSIYLRRKKTVFDTFIKQRKLRP